MTAQQLASALRKIADHYEQFGEQELCAVPTLNFDFGWEISPVATIKMLPHPIRKKFDPDTDPSPYAWFRATYEGIKLVVAGPRKDVCTLVTPAQPAVYHCDPILSPEDEAAIEAKA